MVTLHNGGFVQSSSFSDLPSLIKLICTLLTKLIIFSDQRQYPSAIQMHRISTSFAQKMAEIESVYVTGLLVFVLFLHYCFYLFFNGEIFLISSAIFNRLYNILTYTTYSLC